jgi:hypothetical protein
MITPRMRRRRRLLDAYIRVELEERRTPAEKRPLEPAEASPQGRSDDSRVDPGAVTNTAFETAPGRITREAQGGTM